ncbi:MAG TPA: protein kinase [Bryobacteraceae bacterium]|nr:protein kinase [Bryobacteraceae bacterium]
MYHDLAEAPPENRAALLDAACRDDLEFRREVEALLNARDRIGDFLAPEGLVRQIADLTPKAAATCIGTTLGGYEILAVLGAGGMSEVYRARDTRLGRDVALKILPPHLTHDSSRVARFRFEARAASALNHPNAVTIYEVGNDAGTWFIATELIEGVTLRQRLNAGRLVRDEAISIALQCASSLDAAHRAGIIHRDIKPENIMLRSDGLVKVVDFGLARVLEPRADGMLERTQTGSVMGTPRYMSPEQARGEKLDARSDIFSLGAVLFEMICGYAAFPGASTAEVFAALLAAPPDPRHAGPLRDVLSRALQKDAAGRYSSMAEFAAEIRQVDPRRESPPRLWRAGAYRVGLLRSRLKWAVLAVAVAGLAIFAWTWGTRTSPDPVLDVVPLTTFQGAKDYPALAPDGSRVAFSWRPSPKDAEHIYVKPVEGGEPKQLTFGAQEDVLPSWSPDASLIAFCRRVPGQTGYDSRARVPTGIYIVPANGGAERNLGQGWGGVSWSADGRKLVAGGVANGAPDSGGLVLLDIDSRHRTCLTTQGVDSLPAFSPDGKWVAFKREFAGSAPELFVMPASGGRLRQLTSDVRPIEGITWTADSREIVFNSTRRPIEGSLWRVSVSGGQPVAISASLHSLSYPNIARRQGRRLAFNEAWTDSNIYLWMSSGLPYSGPPWRFGEPTAIVNSTRADHSPAISPDGERIAFVSDRTGNEQIWVSRVDGSDPVQLTSFGKDSAGSPRWSPDGLRLAFDVWSSGEANVFTIDSHGGAPRRLSSEGFESWMPAWSHDASRIYFTSRRSGTREIWAMPATGDAAFQVTRGGADEARPSPDGRTVYYTKSTGADCCSMWSIPVGGGPELPVPELAQFRISRSWGVIRDGIYFIAKENQTRQSVRFFSFVTRQVAIILRLEKDPGWSFPALALSSDGRRLLAVQTDREVNDLMMITNFR